MRFLKLFLVTIAVLGSSQGRAAETVPPAADVRKVIDRGLGFMVADAAKWRKEKTCATCHHGVMSVWALTEAKSQGFSVAAETLADLTGWTKERIKNIDHPRDTRPGWNMINTPSVYLATMAGAVPKQQALSADELKQIAGHLARHQEANGSWAWTIAPPQNRFPPFFESDEVVTMLACLALHPQLPADEKEKSELRESYEKGTAWLAKEPPNDTTQAAALRLLSSRGPARPADELRREIDGFLRRQNADGGWSQLKDLKSDAYATGQSLYILSLLGEPRQRAEIQKGVAFLAASQRDDGSWPMIPRAHPGANPAKNTMPITYFGSAWGMLGLLRSIEK